MSRTFALVTLVLVLATAPTLAQWDEKAAFNNYQAPEGSALCAGVATESDGVTRSSVWMLNGLSSSFQRYKVADDAWDNRQNIGTPNVGWGGALVYVRDVFAYPENGWVFAFRGGGSSSFRVYFPQSDTWLDAPPVPGGVVDGGSLCYGGTTTKGTVPYYVIYAFTGHEDSYGNGRFFRYVFPKVPTGMATVGVWQQLPSIPVPIGQGGALAWCPFPSSTIPRPWVIALTGGFDDIIWRYDPTALPVWSSFATQTPHSQRGGACLTTRADGSSVMLSCGDPNDDYFFFYPLTDAIDPYSTPESQRYKSGGALAQVGNVCYTEFGEDNQSRFWGLLDVPPSDGGQSGDGVGRQGLHVAVRSARHESNFTVRCQPGSVSLKVVNATGAVVSAAKAAAHADPVVLTWSHGTSASGVYLYVISTPSGSVAGKMMVVR